MSYSGFKRLIPLFLIIFIDSLGYFLVLPVLLHIYMPGPDSVLATTDSITYRNVLFGITMSLSSLAMILYSPIMGHISDTLGRKKTMFYCLLAAIFGFLLPVIGIKYKIISLILLGRFITGASSASQPIAQAAITDFSTGKVKAFYLSMIAFAMTLAMMLGPLGGNYLSDPTLFHGFNVNTPYYAAAGLALLNLILMMTLFKDKDQKIAHLEQFSLKEKFVILKEELTKNKVAILLAIFFLLELAWSSYYQSIFMIMKEHFHYSGERISLFLTYIGVWMCIGLTVLYRIILKLTSLKATLMISLVGTVFGMLGCSITSTAILQWIFVVPTAIFVGTTYTSLLTVISHETSKEHQGWALGVASTLLGLAWLLTGFASGFLVSILSTLPLYLSSLAITIAFLLLCSKLRHR